ncbi:hypothetical protein B0I37DRAFT_359808 [Chaetomium sp. MPI-CAGE-AT-0009]|nr:hypothetical protein B0I37DRAFT_359808 [Chaetomium sp. MPI-CAGE-AT-0009]
MADVERSAGGRRGGSLLLPASSFSAMAGGRFMVGVGCFVEAAEKEAAERGSDGVIPAEEEGVIAAVDDCERWRRVRSAGLLRRSWLLEERWPGVCDRGGMGGALSWASASYSSEGGGRESVGDTGAILCERTTLMFCGACGSPSRPSALA